MSDVVKLVCVSPEAAAAVFDQWGVPKSTSANRVGLDGAEPGTVTITYLDRRFPLAVITAAVARGLVRSAYAARVAGLL